MNIVGDFFYQYNRMEASNFTYLFLGLDRNHQVSFAESLLQNLSYCFQRILIYAGKKAAGYCFGQSLSDVRHFQCSSTMPC